MSSLAHPAFVETAQAPEATRGTQRTAAGLALVPAVLDLVLAATRFDQYWAYGVLSLVAAGGLVALAAGLACGRARPWALQAGIWGSLALLVTYLWTHTAGNLFGPARGEVGSIEVVGVAAALATFGLVLALCSLLAPRARARTLSALALVGVALWAVMLLGGLESPAPISPEDRAAAAHRHNNPGLPLPYISQSVREKARTPAGHETPLPAGG